MSILNKVFKKKEDDKDTEISNLNPIVDKLVDKKDEIAGEVETEKGVKKTKELDKNKVSKVEQKSLNIDKARKGLSGYGILVKPLIKEKTEKMAKEGKYVFEVFVNTNKIQIRNAVKDIYGVMPKSINIIKMKGKKTGAMKRNLGKRKDWKKAIVTLEKGASINVYENGKNE